MFRGKEDLLDNILIDKLPKIFERRVKISKKEFELNLVDKNIDSYELLRYDLTVTQIKQLSLKYKLKISGNKIQLYGRLFNYKYYSEKINKIIILWKIYLLKKIIKLQGPARIKRKLCVNDSDFFTLEKCKDIPIDNFISIKDEEGFIYGFNIISIYNLFINSVSEKKNPYTNKKFLDNTFENINLIIFYNRLLNIKLDININKESLYIKNNRLEMRVVKLCQNMDLLNNYTQINWILDLNKEQLITWIRELYDIWIYRASLTTNVKLDICPPNGNPFQLINFNNLFSLSFNDLLENILNILEKFVQSGVNRESKILGTYYVLGALTLVNPVVAVEMPWLYNSLV